MIIATTATDESLRLTLADRSYLSHLLNAKADAIAFRPESFKRNLEAWIGRLAEALSASFLQPKCTSFTIDASIAYLALDLLEDPKLYARLTYYFDDRDYLSIDTGVRFYNELLAELSKVTEIPVLEGLYLRVLNADINESKEVRETLHFGAITCVLSVKRECLVENDILYPELTIEFFDVDDPNAMVKLILVDGHLSGKTRPITFPLSTKGTRRSFFFQLGPESLGAHSQAELGARIQVSHRVSTLFHGETRTMITSDFEDILFKVYLLPKHKKNAK